MITEKDSSTAKKSGKQIGVYLSEADYAKVVARAEQLDRSVSWVCKNAILFGLDNVGNR